MAMNAGSESSSWRSESTTSVAGAHAVNFSERGTVSTRGKRLVPSRLGSTMNASSSGDG